MPKRITLIQQNAELSASFGYYVSRHPDILSGVPKNVCIVFTAYDNPELNKINLKLAKSVIEKEKKPCYKAEKKSRGWRLMKLGLDAIAA